MLVHEARGHRPWESGSDCRVQPLVGARGEPQLLDIAPHGRVEAPAVHWLAGTPTAAADGLALDCLDVRLAVERCVARPEVMLAENAAATVTAAGAIDLAGMRYDLTVEFDGTSSGQGTTLPLRITGPWAAPEVTPAEAAQAAGIGELLGRPLVPPAAAAAPPEPGGNRRSCPGAAR